VLSQEPRRRQRPQRQQARVRRRSTSADKSDSMNASAILSRLAQPAAVCVTRSSSLGSRLKPARKVLLYQEFVYYITTPPEFAASCFEKQSASHRTRRKAVWDKEAASCCARGHASPLPGPHNLLVTLLRLRLLEPGQSLCCESIVFVHFTVFPQLDSVLSPRPCSSCIGLRHYGLECHSVFACGPASSLPVRRQHHAAWQQGLCVCSRAGCMP
jgi:hypothetical protein